MQPDKTLTDVQRSILTAMLGGELLVQDRQNALHIGAMTLQPRTRDILVKARLIERFDKTKSVSSSGNGFIITEQGRLALLKSS